VRIIPTEYRKNVLPDCTQILEKQVLLAQNLVQYVDKPA